MKIVFYGGKGGVGKTTSSVATALAFSKAGLRTLLVSTDPAHSISDLLDKKIGDGVVFISNNLYATEIDPEKESERHIGMIRGQMGKIISPVIVDEINSHLDAATLAPGTFEAALFDRMAEIIIKGEDEYDRIVFDTAPTGHTIRLLALPALMSGWLGVLIKKREKIIRNRVMLGWQQREDDPVIDILVKRRNMFNRLREVLTSNEGLSIRFVANPEKLVVAETMKAVEQLEKNGLKVDTIVINKIIPDVVRDDFLSVRKNREKVFVKNMRDHFKTQKIIEIPYQSIDMQRNTVEDLCEYFIKS